MEPIVNVDVLLAERLLKRGVHRMEASRTLQKAELVRCHDKAATEFKAMQLYRYSSTIWECDVQYPAHPSVCISKLSRISIRELEERLQHLSEPHRFTGKVLYGTLCVDALKTFGDSLQSVLEVASGKALVVSIRNAIVSTASAIEVAERLPKGLEIGINSPLLMKLWEDGCVGLLVDNPEDIVLKAILDLDRDVESLKQLGNTLFTRKDWGNAADVYTKGIKILMQLNRSKEDEADFELFYSRVGEAMLQLGRPQEAYGYAANALPNCESHETIVTALENLHRHADAIDFLQRKIVSEDPSASRKIVELEVAKRQSQLGIYELDSYISEVGQTNHGPGSQAIIPPALTEFVGPVEVRLGRQDHNGSRRGLFATRAVKAGELLFVNQAMAKGFRDPDSILFRHGDKPIQSELFNLSVELAAKARCCPRFAHQLYSLQAEVPTKEIPSMSLLTHLAAIEVQEHPDLSIDIKRIQDIVYTNAQVRSYEGVDGRDSHRSSLWLLFSFVNHSCCPNCETYEIGDFKFLSSARDIASGEELTTSYINFLGTHLLRRYSIVQSRYDSFSCQCDRCAFENRAVDTVPDLTNLYKNFHVEFETARQPARLRMEEAKHFPELVERLLKNNPRCAKLSVQQKNWIRCSFGEAYLASWKGEDRTKWPPLQPFAAALYSVAPCHGLVQLGREWLRRRLIQIQLSEIIPKDEVAPELLQMSQKVYIPLQTKNIESILDFCLSI